EWLSHQSLKEEPRSARHLTVNSGWEISIEAVLGGYFDMVCVFVKALPSFTMAFDIMLEKAQ
ncbi:MAG: hypothetical protein AB8Y84_03710, partial [Coxiella endosymbiont of Haemaphysalis qinghaiensis]